MDCVAVFVVVALVLVALHLRSLRPREVEALSKRWREQEVIRYFSFRHALMAVDADFKRKMASAGRLYSTLEPFECFPSMAAALLKYKKHEWVIVGFERERSVILMWMNKGCDRESVEFQISIEQTASTALANGCTGVLILHNHPNPDPSRYSASRPSTVDIIGSQDRAAYLNQVGVSLFEFVCERGWPHEFRHAIAPSFCPVESYQPTIEFLNGRSRLLNIRLHLIRLFGNSDFRRVFDGMQKRLEARLASAVSTPLQETQAATAPPGWYADPASAHEHRYWDGTAWSDYVSDCGVVHRDAQTATASA